MAKTITSDSTVYTRTSTDVDIADIHSHLTCFPLSLWVLGHIPNNEMQLGPSRSRARNTSASRLLDFPYYEDMNVIYAVVWVQVLQRHLQGTVVRRRGK